MKLLRMSLHSLAWSKYIISYIPWVLGGYLSHCKDHSPPQEAAALALHHVGRQTQADFHSGKVLKKRKRGWKLLGISNQLWDLPKPSRVSAPAHYAGAAKWECQLQYHTSLNVSTKVTSGIWVSRPKKPPNKQITTKTNKNPPKPPCISLLQPPTIPTYHNIYFIHNPVLGQQSDSKTWEGSSNLNYCMILNMSFIQDASESRGLFHAKSQLWLTVSQ